MSLLRVCAFAKCVNRRSLFEKCAAGVSFVDCCQLCASIRNTAVRRISGELKETAVSTSVAGVSSRTLPLNVKLQCTCVLI